MKQVQRIAVSVTLFFLTLSSLIAQDTRTKEIDVLMNRVHQLGIFNGNVLVIEKGKNYL